jgi:hypothetical protein
MYSYQSCVKDDYIPIQKKYSTIVYPNPCDSITNISMYIDSVEQVKINLSDKKGTIELLNQKLSAGNNILSIDMSSKEPGVYTLEVVVGNYVDRIKLLKKESN